MNDPMIELASAISSLFAHVGFAFVEDDHVPTLAEALKDFFQKQQIPIDQDSLAEYYRSVSSSRTGA